MIDKHKDAMNYLSQVVEHFKHNSFVEGYQASDQQALALAISKFFEWDGIKIMETSALALEDANFHGESEIVYNLMKDRCGMEVS